MVAIRAFDAFLTVLATIAILAPNAVFAVVAVLTVLTVLTVRAVLTVHVAVLVGNWVGVGGNILVRHGFFSYKLVGVALPKWVVTRGSTQENGRRLRCDACNINHTIKGVKLFVRRV